MLIDFDSKLRNTLNLIDKGDEVNIDVHKSISMSKCIYHYCSGNVWYSNIIIEVINEKAKNEIIGNIYRHPFSDS